MSKLLRLDTIGLKPPMVRFDAISVNEIASRYESCNFDMTIGIKPTVCPFANHELELTSIDKLTRHLSLIPFGPKPHPYAVVEHWLKLTSIDSTFML